MLVWYGQWAQLIRSADFDPEDLDHPGQSSDDDSEGDANQQTGREHYQAVGYELTDPVHGYVLMY